MVNKLNLALVSKTQTKSQEKC